MKNNLRKISQELRAFAKRTKDFKYTNSALITFLMTGMLFASNNIFAENENTDIKNQVNQINTSINQIRTDFKRARKENNKLIKDTTLELTQLMEQGDYVTKSPWSSWQYGMNYFYNDWHGSFKGKGNKVGNVIYKRDQTLNRYIAKPISEGSANNTTTLGFAYEPNAAIPISASITPKSITKTNPNIQKNVAIASLPSFEPRVVVEPVAPNRPSTPTVVAPTLSLDVSSDGNGQSVTAFGNANNAMIEGVALTSGNFKISRSGIGSAWTYDYSGYGGANVWADGSNAVNPWGDTIAPNGTWSSKSGNGTNGSGRGFLSVINYNNKAALYNNAEFLYSNKTNSTGLAEFMHLDVHGSTPYLDVQNGLTTADASITELNDIKSIAATANQQKSATITNTAIHYSMNAGKITIEGGGTSLTNTYTHDSYNNVQATVNTGDVIFTPYKDGGNMYDQYTAGFIVSPDGGRSHNIMYNAGKINTWTRNAVMFGYAAGYGPGKSGYRGNQALTIKNTSTGELNMYGENSAGIYLLTKSALNLKMDNPLNLYGDFSAGLYVPVLAGTGDGQDSTIEGDLKVNIGATNVGNTNYTKNGTIPTAGSAIVDYDVNKTDTKANPYNANPKLNKHPEYIRNSFGILSTAATSLTSHEIKIYDKAEKNVGVMPNRDVLLTLGTGSIEIHGEDTAKDNIGIYVNGKGAVKSTGNVTIDKGIGNLAVFAKGGTLPSGATEQVSVNKIEGTNTKNSVFIYAESTATKGATVKASELNISNATIEADADTDNKKDTGAIFATGENTVVTVTRTATPTSANIEITGRERKNAVTGEADGYVGFGFFANNKAKINANYNSLKVTDGSSAVVAQNANTEINMDHGKVEYSGPGYALFSDGSGKINLTNGELVLDGKATGFSVDYNATTQPIDLTSTTVNINSDDAILMSVKNVTSLGTTGMGTALLSKVGLTPASIGGTGTRYKFAVLDGATINVDGNIDKADTTSTSDSYIFTRRIQLQNTNINVLSGNTVKAHLNTTELASINPNLSVPVGLDVSASGNSTSRATTGVNVANGATITVDRTDSGNGGVGAYVNYGTISNDGKIEVEKTTPNDFAVGLYATNGTQVDNKTNGTIEVGGKDSIGILGLSYRIDSKGNVVYEKFGTTGPSSPVNKLGTVDITSSGKITLDGDNSLGIYAKNNSLNATGTNMDYAKIGNAYTQATNKGEITMSGKNAIGMITEGGVLTNDTAGKITISGQEGVAMYGTYGSIDPAIVAAQGLTTDRLSAALVNKGTLELADTTGTTPIIGMFTNDADTEIETSGTLNIGKKSYGIYGVSNSVTMSGGTINVGEDGVGIFATGSSDKRLTSSSDVVLQGGTINVGDNQAVGVFIADDATNPLKTTVTNTGTNMTVGTNAFGYVVDSKTGTDLLLGTATNKLTASLGPDSVYAYSNDKNGYVYSNTDITTTGGKSYGLYTAGRTENYGNIDLTGGNGNVGIYSTGRSSAGLGAINYGTITVGGTDLVAKEYGIGMATGYYNETTGAISNEGLIENRGTINVGKDNSIGMYAVGAGSKAINHGTIDISGKNATGMYIDQGAEGVNYGTIKSTGTASGIKGVATVNGGYIKNYGTISITSPGGIGIYQDAMSAIANKNEPTASGVNPLTLANQTGTVNGTKAAVYSATSTDQKYIVTPKGSLLIQNPPKAPRLTINGKEVALTGVDTNIANPTPAYVTAGSTTLDLSLPLYANTTSNAQVTEIGMYVDTSGVNYTNPIQGLNNLIGLENINLIIGTEAAKYTNAKAIEIGQNILSPYNDAISSLTTTGTTLNINSAGLTWLAQPVQGATKPIETLYMVKIPYTFFTSAKDENSYNFLDGLEQRYGVEPLGSRERLIFDKLNGIGKGETHIFTQAVDEMKGHQYANLQQRINATGNTLDKEFKYLRDEWRNPSKQNNKIKVFGARDEYSTDTAGIINYKSNAYGVAYVHEDEKIRMGNSSGWYAGAVTNRFRFKDIGHSREDQTMLKLGVFKTMSPKGDHNGALQWTVSGDVFAGVNNMKRRFWVVDDTFEAKSTYHSYGAAIKNELGYDIRMSEKTHLRPYGALKMEYGKFNDIKEKTGQMRLQVKGNDYFSVKPEVGMEFKFVQPLAVKTNLSVGLTAAYENEIGKLQERNQARVGYTTAGWYNLEKEKEDRRGNGKFDLNIGVDNTRFGVTVNAGYDTKGNNVRAGIGFRAIY